ncbi:hypothetical protein M5K25_001670 [Dendrobium thyrsiflorum]|uniref:Uncharacterized protein n=1 Tax=Dendrobium thyrsiflorum TaxID=117978 RepID=A0ABD0VR24_DENTH
MWMKLSKGSLSNKLNSLQNQIANSSHAANELRALPRPRFNRDNVYNKLGSSKVNLHDLDDATVKGKYLPLSGRELLLDSDGEREDDSVNIVLHGLIDLQVDVEEWRLEDINLPLVVIHKSVVLLRIRHTKEKGNDDFPRPKTTPEAEAAAEAPGYLSFSEIRPVTELATNFMFFNQLPLFLLPDLELFPPYP